MPTHKPRLSELSVSQFTLLSGKTHRTVSQRIIAAGIKPLRTDGKTLYYDPRLVLPALYHDGKALDPTAEKARLDAARAALAELELEKRSGALVDSLDVQALGAAFASGVSQRMLGLRTLAPAIRTAASDEEAAELLEAAVREALEEIARVGDLVGELARRDRRRGQGAPHEH